MEMERQSGFIGSCLTLGSGGGFLIGLNYKRFTVLSVGYGQLHVFPAFWVLGQKMRWDSWLLPNVAFLTSTIVAQESYRLLFLKRLPKLRALRPWTALARS